MSSYIRRIVCLANSKKNFGRCVAGIQLQEGQLTTWIRPISARPGHELSLDDRRYEDGNDVSLLDVVDITLLRPEPQGCQRENHVIDDAYYWKKVDTFRASELLPHARSGGPLWIDGHSSYSGSNDRIPVEDADRLRQSLELVRPSKPAIEVLSGKVKRQVRAEFHLGSTLYNFVVTDTKLEAAYLPRKNGTYQLEGDYLFCISLGEPFEGHRYKLVAAAIPIKMQPT